MIEEIKARQTNQEQSKKVSSGQDGAGVTVLDAVSGLLGSKKIPPLDAVQMLALLHYLFKAANPPLRFQIAEVVYRYDHDHPNAQDLFLACTLPSAEKAARRKAEKLFVHPSDWQVELMYDGAVAAAIEMFQLNPPVSSIPNAFPCYVVRALTRGMLRSYFMREENSGIRPVGDVRAVRTRKTVVRNTVEREIIVRELLDQVTNYGNLRLPVRATLQCIVALGPDFALKEHAYTASGKCAIRLNSHSERLGHASRLPRRCPGLTKSASIRMTLGVLLLTWHLILLWIGAGCAASSGPVWAQRSIWRPNRPGIHSSRLPRGLPVPDLHVHNGQSTAVLLAGSFARGYHALDILCRGTPLVPALGDH